MVGMLSDLAYPQFFGYGLKQSAHQRHSMLKEQYTNGHDGQPADVVLMGQTRGYYTLISAT